MAMVVFLVEQTDDKGRKTLHPAVFSGLHVTPEYAADHIHQFNLFPKARELTVRETNVPSPQGLLQAVKERPKEKVKSSQILVPHTPKPKVGEAFLATDGPLPSDRWKASDSAAQTPVPPRFRPQPSFQPLPGASPQTGPEKTMDEPLTSGQQGVTPSPLRPEGLKHL